MENTTYESAMQSQSYDSESNGAKKRKLFVIIGGLLIFIVLAFVIGLSIFQRLNNNNHQANVLLATVGDKKIYTNDVKDLALESFVPNAIDNKVIKLALDLTVERAILDREAQQKGIKVETQPTKQQYYDKLKEKVLAGEIASYTEYDITWWIPPPPYEQKPEFKILRDTQEKMAQEIARQFKSGEDPYKVAIKMTNLYPQFRDIIGFNGGLLLKNIAFIESAPRTLNFDPLQTQNRFFQLLYSMKKGDISFDIWPDGSGGAVIKMVDAKNGEKKDYKTWLAEQIKKNVKYNEVEVKKL